MLKQLETYAFGDYARDIQSFFWNEVCDWYIELCKGRLLNGTADEKLQVQRNLVFVLDTALRLLHPVIPFVTEEIWDMLPVSGIDDHRAAFLMLASWPDAKDYEQFVNTKAEANFELAKMLISTVRSIRARYRLSPKEELALTVKTSEAKAQVIDAQKEFIIHVGRLKSLDLVSNFMRPKTCVATAEGDVEIFVELGGLVDLHAEATRLSKELEKLNSERSKIQALLSQEAFISKAAQVVIDKKKAHVEELNATIESLSAQLQQLG